MNLADSFLSNAAASNFLPILVSNLAKHSSFSESGSEGSPKSSWTQWCMMFSLSRPCLYSAPIKNMCPMYCFRIFANFLSLDSSSKDSNSAMV